MLAGLSGKITAIWVDQLKSDNLIAGDRKAERGFF
jgi:hypothetical protein